MGRKNCPLVSLVEKEKCMEPPCLVAETVDPICKVRISYFLKLFLIFYLINTYVNPL